MRRGTGIVPETGQRQFFGDAVATDHRAALQYQAPQARLGQIGGCDQAVVSSAGDDDVEAIRHDIFYPGKEIGRVAI
jgi:hypothetical protein